jgi:putative radical SAM enzyme (TIGR03279 family)
MNKKHEHIVKRVKPGSIAEEMEIEAGDKILAIDNTEIEDIFDYQFLVQDTYIEVLVEKPDGEQWLLEVDKEYDEDLGIEFENGLMDDYRSCHNKCIFCFIDQMPKGMRNTLYFKDDDSRLSFLQGNYVTLTNMSEHDIDRICRYHLSPINISFQTMNPELRCKMLNNRFAGEALKKVDRLNEADIEMNGQIVLCKGVNDGDELRYSIEKMMKYIPNLRSVSVVPVGLSKYRDGLYPLEPFCREDACAVIDTIEEYQKICMDKYGIHFMHASDEWYILAERPLPEEERYDGYLQLENGVGMIRLLINEFDDAIKKLESERRLPDTSVTKEVSVATGRLAAPYIRNMCAAITKEFPNINIHVYEIVNNFFGERITVSGLLTGQDICAQLKGKALGDTLFLPQNVLRSGETVFLDDLTVSDLEKTLQVKINIVKSSGYDFLNVFMEQE